MTVAGCLTATATAWEENLHAVKAGCSVACLEWGGRGEKRRLLKPILQKRLGEGKGPGRKSPRLLSEERRARD